MLPSVFKCGIQQGWQELEKTGQGVWRGSTHILCTGHDTHGGMGLVDRNMSSSGSPGLCCGCKASMQGAQYHESLLSAFGYRGLATFSVASWALGYPERGAL